MMKFTQITTTAALALLLAACGGSVDTDSNVRTLPASRMASVAATVSTSDIGDTVQELYIAYFGRAADPGGLAEFTRQMQALGAPADIQALNAAYGSDDGIRSLVNSFSASVESQTLYGADTSNFIASVYRNILNRAPDPEGAAFWTDAIHGGRLSRDGACLAILAAAMTNTTEQGLIDAAVVLKKIKLSQQFTAAVLDAHAEAFYAGDAAAKVVRTMLASISSETTDDQISSLISDAMKAIMLLEPPIAKILVGSPVALNTPVTLNGFTSFDPRGLMTSFSWRFSSLPSGSNASISAYYAAVTTFTPDIPGTYSVILTVADGMASGATEVKIVVPPV
jgi:hypothetical protein